jgi:hypothetical protein
MADSVPMKLRILSIFVFTLFFINDAKAVDFSLGASVLTSTINNRGGAAASAGIDSHVDAGDDFLINYLTLMFTTAYMNEDSDENVGDWGASSAGFIRVKDSAYFGGRVGFVNNDTTNFFSSFAFRFQPTDRHCFVEVDVGSAVFTSFMVGYRF